MTLDDLFARCSPEPNTGCWLWTGRTERVWVGTLSAEEHAELRAAADREAIPLAVWARSRLLLVARRPS